jgi:hypothetical protein
MGALVTQAQHSTVLAPVRVPSLPLDEYQDIVARMQAAFPDESARIGRAVGVLLSSKILETDELGVYLVQCSEGGNLYYRTTTWNCTCPDRMKRGVVCKHSHALTVMSVASAVVSYQRAQDLARYQLTSKGLAATQAPERQPVA